MQIPDPEQLLALLAERLRPLVGDNTVLVGIHSGGAWLAERLQPLLGGKIPVGALDISFYRDDFEQRGLSSQVKPSNIPFDVENSHIVLVDDVLYTGRTIRGAMNELFDYGRPARITLAVLVDRGGREMPVEAQVVGTHLELEPSQTLELARDDAGKFHFNLHEAA